MMTDRSTGISVVVPVRDDAPLLRRCLVALTQQTLAPDEIIVVDNASRDDTAAVARSFGVTVVTEPVPGIGSASAAGYNAAAGSVIARLDADSVPASDWVETIERYFRARPDVEAITNGAFFSDGPRILRSALALVYLGAYFASTSLALGHLPLFGSNMAFRACAWERARDRVHSTDVATHDDLDLAFHIGPVGRIRVVPSLRATISIRPLTGGGGLLRWRRGFHTVFVHWPEELPWLRVGRRAGAWLRRTDPSADEERCRRLRTPGSAERLSRR
jgi:glycosyltransferase involved in cell wall biosynthesis